VQYRYRADLRRWAFRPKERTIAETHMAQGDMLIRDIIGRMRHDGCGCRVAKAELVTGIPGASRRVRRIVLVEG
jgi:hypothetical protein